MSTKPSDTKIDNEIIWRMIKSIHSKPGLREWVTLESQALKPIFVDANIMGKKAYLIHLLLAVPNKFQDKPVFMSPWGYICWHWPSMRLMAMINVSGLWDKENSPHLSQHTVCTNHYANDMQNAIESNLNNLDINSDALKSYYQQVLNVIQPIYQFNINQTEAITRNRTNEVSINNQVVESEQVNHGATTFDNISRAYELLPSHMTAARNLIYECGHKVLLMEWQRIFVAMNQPMFSVAVVGEFSSGKSTLINKLLHEELVPVGNLPTTSKLTRIIYGPEPVIKYMDNVGKVTHMPFDIETCKGLIVNNQDSDLNNLVQLEIPNEWLNHTGIQLIDTPGINEISGNRAALVTEAIASCDATLVVINATSPLSLTERHFVEQHILLRHIPRVAVVLTNLDRIKEAERSSLISFLKEEISEWSTDASLWCSHEYLHDSPKSDLLLTGAKDIREVLAGWARDSQHLELRGIQYGSQLYSLLSLLKDSLLLQKDVLALSKAEQQARIKEQKAYIEHCRLDWEDLRIELLNRRLSIVKRVESELKDYRTDILDNLKTSLLQVGDPKVWWEEIMPTILRNQLKNKIKSMNISLQHKIIEDAKWLDAQISTRFAQHLADAKPDTVIAVEDNNNIQGNKPQIANLDKYKTGVRAGIITLSLLSLPIMGPMATVAIGAGGGLISEQLFKNSLQKQKGELNVHLEKLISEMIEENINYAVSKIKRIYDNLIGETKLMESTWLTSNLAAMDISIASSLETTELTNRIHKIDQLLSDLSIWVEVER